MNRLRSSSERRRRASLVAVLLLLPVACVGWVGCVAGPGASAPSGDAAPAPTAWDFFATPPVDVWSQKIVAWQGRQRSQANPLGERRQPVLRPAEYARLLDHSDAFLARERRGIAARVHAYSLKQARRHYRWDPATDLAGDPWPSSQQLYEANGDDCDGLDLIAYDLLLALGFPPDSLYRVIVHRASDGANHMATLWFEDRGDPWVIDATGAISRRLVRFSELRGWTPIRLFDEDELYGVAPAR